MAKKKSPAQKTWEWFSRWYRLLMSDENGYLTCYTCGTVKFWKDGMQVGHLLDGRSHAILYEVDCVKPQCVSCNMFKHGLKEVYIPKFIEEYGQEMYDSLIRLKHSGKKYNKRELGEMLLDYKHRAKELAESKGLNI